VNFDQMMKQLRDEYVATIPEKISSIDALWKANDSSGVREAFHKLKGTGRTYGVPELSDIGETLENFCLAYPDQLSKVLPNALELLESIYRKRTKDEELDVQSDPHFQQILSLMASQKAG
jgi:HPt (histidine-containing phosphotransfer) domain-containing protein